MATEHSVNGHNKAPMRPIHIKIKLADQTPLPTPANAIFTLPTLSPISHNKSPEASHSIQSEPTLSDKSTSDVTSLDIDTLPFLNDLPSLNLPLLPLDTSTSNSNDRDSDTDTSGTISPARNNTSDPPKYNLADSSTDNSDTQSSPTKIITITATTPSITPTINETPKRKKKGDPNAKRGRKPAQDPPYTKLYKQPWLDGWATCRRLALEYIEETRLIAEKASLPFNEVRRLPSQADLSGGNAKRVWTPMELILARAFLKEADLVNTSTKRGAMIRGGILIDQLPELISQSVLPSTHAVHYLPKEREKDPNKPKKEKKPKDKSAKKQKTEQAAQPPPIISPFFSQPLPVPQQPISFLKC